MIRISGLFLTLAALSVVSCEQAIDLGGIGAAQIVIESRLKAGAKVRVDVRVIDSFGRPSTSEGLGQTVGSIKGSDGGVGSLYVAAFTDSTAALVLDSVIVREGITYTLELNAPGFAPLKSVTTVPAPVTLSAATELAYTVDTLSVRAIELPISFADPIEELNYYHLLISIQESDLHSSDQLPRKPQVASLVTKTQSMNSSTGAWYFRDLAFRNGTFAGTVYVDRQDIVGFTKPVAIVELRTVSQAYYNYFISRSKWQNPEASSTVDIQADNVVGGSGVFGSYSSSTVQYTLLK